MWLFNLRAAIAGGIGFIVAATVFAKFDNRPVGVVCGIVTAMAIDVWMRYTSEDSERPLIDPDAGGHVWFAPVWFVGIILLIILGLSEL